MKWNRPSRTPARRFVQPIPQRPTAGKLAGVTTILQTCPQRTQERIPTIESIRASDIGDNFVMLEHPPNETLTVFFANVLRTMANAATQYVLRLEDDVIVNRNIIHNFLTWKALADPLFGAGWLFAPDAAISDTENTSFSKELPYRNSPYMWGALAVAMPTKYAEICLKVHLHRNAHPNQDLLLSETIWINGKKCFFHTPSLAENRDPPTIKGTTYPPGTTTRHLFARETFDINWKRR